MSRSVNPAEVPPMHATPAAAALTILVIVFLALVRGIIRS
jgi:hypothetical protein